MVTLRTIFSPMKFLRSLDPRATWEGEGNSSWFFPQTTRFPNVPNINLKKPSLRVLLDVDINRKMGVDISHFILEALRNADNQVVYDGFDSPECSNILAGTMMQFDTDEVFRRMGEANREMGQVLRKLA